MTFALKKDGMLNTRKLDIHIFQLSVEKREYQYIGGDTCTFKNLFALKVLINSFFFVFLIFSKY